MARDFGKDLKVFGVLWIVIVGILVYSFVSGKANVPANQTGGGSPV